MQQPPALAVGSRVTVDGSRGTVRYIGPVATSKTPGAVYAGIEWDDASRGKNDGAVCDAASGTATRYFTAGSATGASFVKLELVDCGRGFEGALVERYCDTSTGSDGGALVGLSGKAVPVLLVGDDKVREQQALGRLTHLVLREARVAVIGWPAGAPPVCPRVREVDLQGNLLQGWGEVAALGRALPLLRVLNLADNRLPPLTEALAAELAGCLPALRTLIVSETGLAWDSLTRLCALAPGLEELHAAGCGIARLTEAPLQAFDPASVVHGRSAAGDGAPAAPPPPAFLPPHTFPHVKTLNLSSNPLQGWEQVHYLGSMPALSWLQLNNCGLQRLWAAAAPAAPSAAPPPFAHLEQLSLAGSDIREAWVIDALDSFPSLRSVRLTNADFALPHHPALGPVEARQLIIARCPRLTALCGSEVRMREREDSEKAYARRVAGLFAEVNVGGEGGGGGGGGGGAAAPAPALRSTAEIFGEHAVGPQPEFNLLAPPVAPATTLAAEAPVAFSRGSDAGIIRARGGEFVVGGAEAHYTSTNPFIRSPVPLHTLSAAAASAGAGASAAAPAYAASMDPWGLGARDPAAAARMLAFFPRFFLLAAKFDLLAPGKAGGGALGGGTLAASSVPLLLRSMAGASCMLEPVRQRLPLSTTVLAVKQLAARLFKCDLALQRLSFRESAGAYPALLDDDQRPLSYYGVAADGEILVEEVDPAGACAVCAVLCAVRARAAQQSLALVRRTGHPLTLPLSHLPLAHLARSRFTLPPPPCAEARRQEAEAEAVRAAKVAAQAAQGEALRRAQEQSVAAARRGAASSAAPQ